MSNRWLLLAAIVSARSGVGVQLISIGSLMPSVRDHFSIDTTQASILLGLFMFSGIFLSLPSGLLTARFGIKNILILGMGLLSFGGLLLSMSPSYEIAVLGRLLGGIGAVLITVSGAKCLAEVFKDKEEDTAMSLLGVSFPFGIGIGLTLLPYLHELYGLRACLLFASVVPIFPLIVIMCLSQGKIKVTKVVSKHTWKIQQRELITILLAGLSFTLVSAGGYVVFSGYAPELFLLRGATQLEASFLVSLFSWLVILTIPLGGIISDYFKRSITVICIGCITSALAMFKIGTGESLNYLLLLVGLCCFQGLAVGPIMAIPNKILNSSSLHTGMGIFYSVYYLGATLLPILAGYWINKTETLDNSVLFSSLCMFLAPIMVILAHSLKEKKC